jgi:hypothetical protein
MKRTTFAKKSTAKKYRGAGRRVYQVEGGYRVSPECPRSKAKRGALIKQRTKTKRKARAKPAVEIVWTDTVPF